MKHIFLFFAICVVALSNVAVAQVPNKISYQGLLTTSSGSPVVDGSYDLKFDFYNLSAAGDLRHTETQNGVAVERGTFSVLLNPPAYIFSESLWVEVTTVAGPISGLPITFSPRSVLTSAPYSLAPWVTVGNTISYSSGFVGIGTTNPQYNLHIKNSGYASLTLENTTTNLVNTIHNKAGNVWTYFDTFPEDYSPTESRYKASSSMMQTTGLNGLSLVTIENAPIDFYTYGNNHRMVITGSGNVGIGTTAPVYKLDVNGTINATNILKNGAPFGTSQWTTNGSNIYYNSGNVGIGTTSPNFALDVKTGSKPVVGVWGSVVDRTFTGSTPDEPTFATYCIAGTKFGIGHTWGGLGLLAYDIDTYGAGNIQFFTGNNAEGIPSAERMRITRAGNVGIGTTSPGASSLLELSSNTKGVVLPRMTKTQRNAIASPVAGMVIYQTDNTPGLRVYDGTNWMRYTETAD
jgi:hypothetical protein